MLEKFLRVLKRFQNIYLKYSSLAVIKAVVGMRTLCQNNFRNNRMQKESGIMLE